MKALDHKWGGNARWKTPGARRLDCSDRDSDSAGVVSLDHKTDGSFMHDLESLHRPTPGAGTSRYGLLGLDSRMYRSLRSGIAAAQAGTL